MVGLELNLEKKSFKSKQELEQLKGFIRDSLKKGFDKEQVYLTLIKKGWTKEQVTVAFKEVEEEG